MPHAALWVVQPQLQGTGVADGEVSMPHAALWVVQLATPSVDTPAMQGFNAARGFVGGAASERTS